MTGPRAAPAHFPDKDHGTLEQIWLAEEKRKAAAQMGMTEPVIPAFEPKPSVRAVAIPIEALKDRPAARPSNGRSVGAQYDARALGLTVWCDQCERMVKREKALRCPSRFCKAKSAASAPIRRAL